MRLIGVLFLACAPLACGPDGAPSIPGGASGGSPSGGSTGDYGAEVPSGGGSDGGAQPNDSTGGASVGVGGTSQDYLRRVDRFCDALCAALRLGAKCTPPAVDCELTCVVGRKQAAEMGCSYEPVLDCADAHPEVFNFTCETGVQMAVVNTCDAVSDEYNACVAAAGNEE